MKPSSVGFHEVTRTTAHDRLLLAMASAVRGVGWAGTVMLLAVAVRVMGWV